MSKLINYFSLCTIAQGGKELLLNQITGPVHTIMSTAEMDLYTKKIDGKLVANETIIGADEVDDAVDAADAYIFVF